MIQNLIFEYLEFFFFWKYYFGFWHTTFLHSPICFSRHYQSFFKIFKFSNTKPQSQQKLANFTIQFCSKNLTHFMNFSSLDIENNMLPHHNEKPFSLYKFSSQSLSVWCQKKHFPCNISWRPTTALLKRC